MDSDEANVVVMAGEEGRWDACQMDASHGVAAAAEKGGSGAVEGSDTVAETATNDNENQTAVNTHEEHFFILSSAGKPIYARHDIGTSLAEYMGIIQAMVSFFEDDDQDTLQCIDSHNLRIYFLLKGPIYLVATTRIPSVSESMIRFRLTMLYGCIISITTSSTLQRIFKQRQNYDLRQLLQGSEPMFDRLCDTMQMDPGLLLSQNEPSQTDQGTWPKCSASIQVIEMPTVLRSGIGTSMAQAAKESKDILFAMLVANDHALIQLVRTKKHSLSPIDYHLIVNMLQTSNSFRTAGETWTPMCLPSLDEYGFCHIYVHYPDITDSGRPQEENSNVEEDIRMCFVLISKNTNAFFAMSDVRKAMQKGLKSSGCWEKLKGTLTRDPCITDTSVDSLIHFVYIHKYHGQYTMPGIPKIYDTSDIERRRFYQLYGHAYSECHPVLDDDTVASENIESSTISSESSLTRSIFTTLGVSNKQQDQRMSSSKFSASPAYPSVRMFFATFESESVLAWMSRHFDMYLVLEPTVSKKQAIHAANQLQRWIQKHESRLFLSKVPLL